MAIQFPNFLSVPVRTPDYSGLGDIVNNYYAGKAMPKDDLIKAIQAEFARPDAEQSLLSKKLSNTSTSLSNRKSQLDIEKMIQEVAQQKAFEQQLKQALSGGGMPNNPGASSMPMNAPMSAGAPPSGSMPGGMSPQQSQAVAQALQNGGGQAQINGVNVSTDLTPDGIDPTKIDRRYRKFDQMATGLPDSAYTGKGGAPVTQDQPGAVAPIAANFPLPPMPAPPQPELHEIDITKGSPHLAGIDQMWENNPQSREFLKKRGYEKKQEIKFNQKTGQTSIITSYPSGRVTTQSTIGGAGTGEAPLTNKMVSKHQGIISAVDTAIPILNQIKDLKSYPYLPGYHGGEYANYQGLVNQALDSIAGAFGLPQTDKGLETVRGQVERTTFETAGAYRKRIENLVKDLIKRQQYSAGEVKKTLKNPPIDGESEASNMSDDELRAIANES